MLDDQSHFIPLLSSLQTNPFYRQVQVKSTLLLNWVQNIYQKPYFKLCLDRMGKKNQFLMGHT